MEPDDESIKTERFKYKNDLSVKTTNNKLHVASIKQVSITMYKTSSLPSKVIFNEKLPRIQLLYMILYDIPYT